MKILILTSTRADFGLLKNLYLKLKKNFDTKLIVTGTHLSKLYGETIKEIKKNKINIYKTIKWKSFLDNEINVSKNFAETLVETSKILNKNKCDLLILLGDRYEILAAAVSAHLSRIPVAHLHGGELTSGVVDDAFRHSITKFSHIHFVSNQIYKKRVIQLGEIPKTVHVVGGLGVDSIKNSKLLNKILIEKTLKIKFLKKNIIITFHPETIGSKKSKKQINVILDALAQLKDTKLIFTMPGADLENSFIYKKVISFVKKNPNAFFYRSLGQKLYFSLLNQVDFMIGNSSSGILEMPYFKKISINLGSRQDGRLKASTVIDTKINKKAILSTIKKFYKGKFINLTKNFINPYGYGGASNKIATILKNTSFKNKLSKKFYDIK